MRKFSCIALKIFSIYLFIRVIMYIYMSTGLFIALIEQPDMYSIPEILFSLVPVVIYLLFSSVLWFYSEQISKFIVKEDNEIAFNSSFDFDKFQQISFSIVGVVFLIIGISGMAKYGIKMLIIYHHGLYRGAYIDLIPEIIVFFIKTVFGIWLLIGSKGIVCSLKKAFSGIENNSNE
ncbi:hypothetical protein BBF96_12145 [Anoxybacter fermentans]|uniref:Uncharacterized protein n=1 Tax=Anoxybacter fermentans TaxID=1323375 RepID=A0A3Q9HTH9_9FIRM|nr:hypothetical protein [Anoxybacter fermentans]AZR74081.1 hypothetical protein BBF96_12145 [Anoxybacter fermentans]